MEMAKSKPTAATLVRLSVMPNLLKSKQPRCIWINGTIRVRREPVRQPAGATEHTLFASHCQREVCAARRIAARNTGHLETSPSYRRPAVGEPTKSRKLDYIRLSSGKSRSYRFGSSVIKRSECAKACDPMMKSASKRFGPDARTVVAVSHDVQNVGQPQAIPTVETQSPRRCRYPREGHSRTILWPSARPTGLRSEDRRVGKEGRSRWSTYHLKKRRMRRTNSKEDFK